MCTADCGLGFRWPRSPADLSNTASSSIEERREINVRFTLAFGLRIRIIYTGLHSCRLDCYFSFCSIFVRRGCWKSRCRCIVWLTRAQPYEGKVLPKYSTGNLRGHGTSGAWAWASGSSFGDLDFFKIWTCFYPVCNGWHVNAIRLHEIWQSIKWISISSNLTSQPRGCS